MSSIYSGYNRRETIAEAIEGVICSEGSKGTELNSPDKISRVVDKVLRRLGWEHQLNRDDPLSILTAIFIVPSRKIRVEKAVNDKAKEILYAKLKEDLGEGCATSLNTALQTYKPEVRQRIADRVRKGLLAARRERVSAAPVRTSPADSQPRQNDTRGRAFEREIAEIIQNPRNPTEAHFSESFVRVVERKPEEVKENSKANATVRFQEVFMSVLKGCAPGVIFVNAMMPKNLSSFNVKTTEDPNCDLFVLGYDKAQTGSIVDVESGGWKKLVGVKFHTPKKITGKIDYKNGIIEFDKNQIVGNKKIGWGSLNVTLRKIEFKPPSELRRDDKLIVTVDTFLGSKTDEWTADELMNSFSYTQWS